MTTRTPAQANEQMTTGLSSPRAGTPAQTTDGGQRAVPTQLSWDGGRSLEAEVEFRSTLVGLALLDDVEPVTIGRDQRYTIRRLLGRGAMGAVFFADDRVLRRPVAIKVMSKLLTNRHRSQDRLRREAWALALLDDPNVLSVYDVDIAASGELFIAMQYVAGHNLREWAEATKPTRAQLISVFVAAGRGLAAAHEKGLVHRDFKPDNVLLQQDGRALVADFGLAGGAPLSLHQPATPEHGGTATEASFMGTPAYMPPEQRRGQGVEARSDQYAYCVSLWELLVGERPTPQTIGQRPRELPRWLYRLLRRGLAERVEDRHADMSTLVAALEHTPTRRRRYAWVGGAVGLGGVLVFAGMQLGSTPDPASGQAAADPCAQVGLELERVWNPARKQALAAHLRELELDETGLAARSVIDSLDRAATQWREDRVAACGQGVDSGCHERWVRRFDRRVELLSALDPAAAPRISELLEPLHTRAYCDLVAVPLDSATDEALDQVELSEALADYDEALARGEQLWAGVQARSSCTQSGVYSDEAAAVSYRLGHIHGERHDAKQALGWLDLSIVHALACANDSLLAAAHLRAAKISAADDNALESAARSLREAKAIMDRSRDLPEDLRVEYELTQGLVELNRGDYAKATARLERVRTQLSEHPLLELEALINLGVAANGLGDRDAARAAWERARELGAGLPGNPPELDIATLNYGLALAHADPPSRDAAGEVLRLVIASRHPSVRLRATTGLIELESNRGHSAEALRLAPGLLELARAHPDQPADDRAFALFWAGQILADARDRRGLEALTEALAIFEEHLAQLPERVNCELSLAWNLLEFGEVELARRHHRRLLSLDPSLTRDLGPLLAEFGRALDHERG
ncbi:Serine/threonine protein kinase [Enhygromyxa salina]|uniref:Serine/threonine protein kinase n=1 Tax=Enhygromyxa salina TaxID=215803 RepID=A0A0C1ZGM8_9BACT|nr:serine/threonine-protein kinase [Enhygromyxa salina]KIG16779.1 Serine/threonine protein kinase [Enhygromyxa salina]